MAKSPYTAEFKAMVAQEYLDGITATIVMSDKYGIDISTMRRWALRYKEHGITAFIKLKGNTKYTSDFKIFCVEKYISGEMSIDETVAKFNISSKSVLKGWINRYNANIELKDYDPKREVYMAESRRKTTLKERKEIVEYCINHKHNYKDAAAFFDVSYSQVYSWVRKFNTNGENGLKDKRGRNKTDDEFDELERLRRENARLKRKLKENDMVVELLKKAKEFERK
jgi:transposase-like protein